MGSIDKAVVSGFLCRLCSEMHRFVIHIYGDKGKKLSLVEKINGYLPITISPSDPLPKTICANCLRRVEQHYDLLMRLSRIKKERVLSRKTAATTSRLEYASSSDDIFSDEEVNSISVGTGASSASSRNPNTTNCSPDVVATNNNTNEATTTTSTTTTLALSSENDTENND